MSAAGDSLAAGAAAEGDGVGPGSPFWDSATDPWVSPKAGYKDIYTNLGRALSKKAGRTDYPWTSPKSLGMKGDAAGWNLAAEDWLTELFSSPTLRVGIERGPAGNPTKMQDLITFRDDSGYGVRYQMDGTFVGLVSPS
jgi:hypothetical protein